MELHNDLSGSVTLSIYELLENNIAGPRNKWIWKSKLPLKIKVFLRQLHYDAILTRDNLRKRKWTGLSVCSFCDNIGSDNHLFFSCVVAKVVWGCWVPVWVRNLVLQAFSKA